MTVVMPRLESSLRAWGTAEFETALKRELGQLDAGQLPLQLGLVSGNYVSDAPFTVLLHGAVEQDGVIRVRAGIFYLGILGGCSCTDDPTPASELNEYCEIQLEIDRETAATSVILVE